MKKNILLIALVVIGILTTSITIFERISVEGKNKGVEIVLDYKEIENLANQSEEDMAWWLKKFKSLGAASVAINEETLESMVEDDKAMELEVVGNIKKDVNWEKKYSEGVIQYLEEADKYDLLVMTKSRDIYDFVRLGLQKRYPRDIYREIEEKDTYYILIDGDEEEALYLQGQNILDVEGETIGTKKQLYSSQVAKIGLGFDEEKIQLIKESGLEVLPRPANYMKYSEKLVEAYIDEMEKYNLKPSLFIFGGKEVLGYPDDIEDLKDYMESNDIKVGLIETGVQREHIEQEGIEKLTEDLNYNAVRVFSVWDWVQTRFQYYNYEGAEEIENTIYRAVTERNIRVIYFKPFKYDQYEYVTDYNEYEKMFNRFNSRIARHGMELGNFTTMKPYKLGFLRLNLMGLGVLGAGMLILNALIKIKDKYINILAGLGIVFVFIMNYFLPSLSDKILALGASIIFPTLSILYLMNYSKDQLLKDNNSSFLNIIKSSIITLLICVAISMVGGMFIGAILSDIRYLLEMDIFRGVKFSQLIPLAMFGIIYISKFGYDRTKEKISGLDTGLKDIGRLMEQNIKVKQIAVMAILLTIGYIYIARTGHETTIQPSDLEMIVRNFLEEVLLARPRTKEFLMAFPALLLTVYVAFRKYKKLIFPFGLVAVIGLTSVVNTFSHLRTPVYLSTIRTFYSVLLGLILGFVAIGIALGLEKVLHSFERRKG